MATKHSVALLSAQEAMEMTRNTPVKFADASWHLDPSRNAQEEFIKEVLIPFCAVFVEYLNRFCSENR